jgi:hypothetical protein
MASDAALARSKQLTAKALEREIERLNAREAASLARLDQNPNLKIQFAAVQDFLQQWAAMNPEDQEKLRKHFEDDAARIVDPYYNEKMTELKEDFDRAMKKMNKDYQFMTEQDEQKLRHSLDNLDKQSITALTQAFRSVQERGMGNSGVLRQLADRVMDDKLSQEQKMQEITDLNKRQAGEAVAAGKEGLLSDLSRGERQIGRDRTEAQRLQQDALVNSELQTDLITQKMAGATDLAPRDLSKFNPRLLQNPVSDVKPPVQRTAATNVRVPQPARVPAAPSAPTPATPEAVRPNTKGMTPEQRRLIRLRERGLAPN